MISVDVRGRVKTVSGPGVVASAVAGLGIAKISAIAAEEALSSGALVRLLPGYAMTPVEVHAIFPQGPRPSLKARIIADFLAQRLSQIRGASKPEAL